MLRKFSGNSLRMKRTHLLYHGTLLYDFDLGLIEKCLRMPPRQPDYRNARPHGDFVMNVPATRQQLADAVIAAFPMASAPTDVPQSRVERTGRRAIRQRRLELRIRVAARLYELDFRRGFFRRSDF